MYQATDTNDVIQDGVPHLIMSDLNPFTHAVIDVVGLALIVYVCYLFCLRLKTCFFNSVSPEQTRELGSKQ